MQELHPGARKSEIQVFARRTDQTRPNYVSNSDEHESAIVVAEAPATAFMLGTLPPAFKWRYASADGRGARVIADILAA